MPLLEGLLRLVGWVIPLVVLAIIIAIQFGLNVTLGSGAAAYLVALGLTTTLRPTIE